MFLVLVTEPSNECGHNVYEFKTLPEAQQHIVKAKRQFSQGHYHNSAEVQLCVVLDEEEWYCVHKP